MELCPRFSRKTGCGRCQVEDPQRNCSDNQRLICNLIPFLSLILIINRVNKDNKCILDIDEKYFFSAVNVGSLLESKLFLFLTLYSLYFPPVESVTFILVLVGSTSLRSTVDGGSTFSMYYR